ncbi:MAG: hypothetical protein AAB965_04145 [Patescibacteria group bacterium]
MKITFVVDGKGYPIENLPAGCTLNAALETAKNQLPPELKVKKATHENAQGYNANVVGGQALEDGDIITLN